MSKPTVTIVGPDGEPMVLPGRFEVCPRCEGAGTHVNPAIDGNGLTAEDFDQDPDFREDYMSGIYDVACERCCGDRVVAVVDEQQLSTMQRDSLTRYNTACETNQREIESERWLRYAETGVMG